MRELVVHEVLKSALHNRPDSEIVYGGRRFTYEQFYERVLRLAQSLKKQGVGRGTVLGVMDVNSHRYLELHYASSMLGAVLHTINFRLPPDDLLYSLQHAGVEWMFVWEGFRQPLAKARPLFRNWVWLTDGDESPEPGTPTHEDLVHEGRAEVPDEAEKVRETDPYSIFYTTGTTGRPKGMLYRHRDMLLASLGILHHLAIHPTGAAAGSRDVYMPCIPFFHIHGWGTALFVPYLGAKLVLPGKATPAEQLRLILDEGVTWSNMVPTQLHMLLEAADQAGVGELKGYKVLTGGSPVPSGLARRARERGIAYSVIYGGSDQLAATISVVPRGVEPGTPEAWEALRTNMLPLAMVEVRLEGDNGQPVPADGKSIGEVLVRSPWLPDGYYKDPERSRGVYEDGWFRSGDLGVMNPDGTLYVVDRKKDAVKSGGEWIATGVLEALISEHPDVAAVAVIARPDERWGERPLAVVQPRGGLADEEARARLEESLRAHLATAVERGRLARFWIPDRFVFVEQLPLTSAGKINKVALRRELVG
ncbi:AMP-binding protein [Thermaerobacter subterraneus]|uniref:Acyl-CoA synthetase (AMP-forming)/AMP-acid ligase II n=1 Tax=Thermaerobacter subterraneus DSM 13965 TaxID=867903 RepID=K6PQC5_9FIRM|nr:AMP-binding protein [Thermaerobacter subterraneus]EKP95142.1 acyl-CoA synthetase (AMP-forming)/AMP-acid ligase II [Thermaerobacter subterraneus DSM 13965]